MIENKMIIQGIEELIDKKLSILKQEMLSKIKTEIIHESGKINDRIEKTNMMQIKTLESLKKMYEEITPELKTMTFVVKTSRG